MGYTKEQVTEEITHRKTTGMLCDVCESKTNTVDDPGWYGFHSQSYDYGPDASNNEWYTVCSPDCLFKFILKLTSENDEDEDIKVDDMDGAFLRKMAKFYKQDCPCI